ncbi:o-succinylbenzoate--CoA ligase [Endozoicomonadaceae bacterium StTr2]
MSSIYCPLRHNAIYFPNHTALACGESVLSYQQLDYQVEICRRVLSQHGITVGQRLGIVSHNSPQLVILLLACWREGVVVCPLNPRFSVQHLNSLVLQLDLQACWLDEPDQNAGIIANLLNWNGIARDPGDRDVLTELQLQDSDICTLLMTSGSSGKAKAVALSLANFVDSARCSENILDLHAGDGWLLSLPLFHVGGMAVIFRCLLASAALVLPEKTTELADILRQQHVTHLSMVNTQLYRLLDSGLDWSQTSARVMLLGGSAVTPSLVLQCRAAGLKVLTSFGMTETTALACCGEPIEINGVLTSGSPLPGRDIVLADNGEILLRGPGVFSGYWINGELDSVRDENGWFHSRDKARWVQGQLLVEGRLDNMMISGGENIQPEEIERVLQADPDIAEALVVPVNSHEFGQRPVAFIHRKNAGLEAPQIAERLAAALAKFKVPDYFILCSGPLADSGLKVNRRHYKERALEIMSNGEKNTLRDGFIVNS